MGIARISQQKHQFDSIPTQSKKKLLVKQVIQPAVAGTAVSIFELQLVVRAPFRLRILPRGHELSEVKITAI